MLLQNEAAFDEVFQHANFNTFVFRNRVKLETYNVSYADKKISGAFSMGSVEIQLGVCQLQFDLILIIHEHFKQKKKNQR